MNNEIEKWNNNDFIITNLLHKILEDTQNWIFHDKTAKPWFRGQNVENGPKPTIFRNNYDEFNMVTTFRNRSNALRNTPETNRIDKWLFLMQHYGVPTRLLDWTESPLIALYFALQDGKEDDNSTLWILHPGELNVFSIGSDSLPNTWTREDRYIDKLNNMKVDKKIYYDESKKLINIKPGIEYFRLAFSPKLNWKDNINLSIVENPIAINSNYLDMRMLVQKSCFTIHGTNENNLEEILDGSNLVKDKKFIKYIIPKENREHLLLELKKLGIDQTSIFPDLEGFSIEMKNRYI